MRKLMIVVLFASMISPVWALPAPTNNGGGSTVRWSSSVKFADVQHHREIEEEVAPEAEVCGILESRAEKIKERMAHFVEQDTDYAEYVLFRLEDWLAKSASETNRHCLVQMLVDYMYELLAIEPMPEEEGLDILDTLIGAVDSTMPTMEDDGDTEEMEVMDDESDDEATEEDAEESENEMADDDEVMEDEEIEDEEESDESME